MDVAVGAVEVALVGDVEPGGEGFRSASGKWQVTSCRLDQAESRELGVDGIGQAMGRSKRVEGTVGRPVEHRHAGWVGGIEG